MALLDALTATLPLAVIFIFMRAEAGSEN